MPENDDKNRGQAEQTAIAKNVNQSSAALKVTPVRLPKTLWWAFAVGGALLIALLLVSNLHPSMTERVKFFTGNALNLLLLVVIIVQAIISRWQWAVMKRQGEAMEQQGEAMQLQLDAMKNQETQLRSQAETMQGQLTVMREQTEAIKVQADASQTSAKAAEISALAAKDTAEVALKLFVTSERPELYFKRTQLYELEVGKDARGVFLVCNGGRISAYRIRIQFNFCAPPRAIFDRDKVLPWDDAIIDRIDVIPPNAELTDRPYLPFQPTQAQLIALGNGTLSLYIYGRMAYEDGYGREYNSSFYRQYNPREPLELMYAPESVKTREDHDAEAKRQKSK